MRDCEHAGNAGAGCRLGQYSQDLQAYSVILFNPHPVKASFLLGCIANAGLPLRALAVVNE